jgi:site-specific recombinase XerD
MNTLDKVENERQLEIEPTLDTMRKAMVIRNYATKTITTYISVLKRYFDQLKKPIEDVTPKDIMDWQYYLVNDKGISWSLFNQMVCALRFYFQNIRNRDWAITHIPFQRKRRQLPSILSKEEVSELLAVTKNPKHHAILATLYSTGLRLGELLNLRIADIDSAKMLVHVRQGKGGKDRQVQLSNGLLGELRDYYRSCLDKPKTWLFPSTKPDIQLDPSTVQRMVTAISKKTEIVKKVTPHTLRHCFATHLLESQTDLRTIQSMLGHSNIQTTEIYLHVAAHHLQTVRNPFDNLPAASHRKTR